LLALAALSLAAVALVATSTTSSMAGTLGRQAPSSARLGATPGVWIDLTTSAEPPIGGNPAVWLSSTGVATVLWYRSIDKSEFTYEAVNITPAGAVAAAPVSIFKAGWLSLTDDPTLVTDGKSPLLIFNGARSSESTDPYSHSCVVGALEGKPSWTLQTWSLSSGCYNPNAGAVATKSGELAAAWPGSFSGKSAVLYRVGVSPTIPATGPDDHIATSEGGDVGRAGLASDIAGNDDVYIAWSQFFSKPSSQDGYYVKNVTADGGVHKAPGTGTNSVNDVNGAADIAVANSNTHPGIFMAYCSDGNACTLLLWKVGTAKPLIVPHSAPASDVAISAGPDGRIWVAWYNHTTNDVSTVRTNKADTAFGPVETYKTPCFEDGVIGLSGGSFDRLDVALQCLDNSKLQIQQYVTQSLAGLSLHASATTIKDTVNNTVTYSVTDAGDAVAGVLVTVDGKSGHTTTAGTVSFTFPKGSKTGHFAVTASESNYYAAHGELDVDS
jgi:hypothetical protein